MVPKTENHPSLTFRKITCNILQYITVSVIALYINYNHTIDAL